MATNSSHLNDTSFSFDCFRTPTSVNIFIAFTVVTVLLLPLSIFILLLGFWRWKQSRPASHSDHFTYHAAALEVLTVALGVMYVMTQHFEQLILMEYCLLLFCPIWAAKVHINSLTCVERYLAVVHPVKYLGLKKRGGVMMRNISIGCVWLSCVIWATCILCPSAFHITLFITSLGVAVITVSFCSISVLCVLIRPGPAKVGGHKVKVDQSKKKAFHTVVIILGMLLVTTVGMLLCEFMSLSNTVSDKDRCAIMTSGVWFGLPSSLVLPLLFLHRLGKQSWCKGKAKPAA